MQVSSSVSCDSVQLPRLSGCLPSQRRQARAAAFGLFVTLSLLAHTDTNITNRKPSNAFRQHNHAIHPKPSCSMSTTWEDLFNHLAPLIAFILIFGFGLCLVHAVFSYRVTSS